MLFVTAESFPTHRVDVAVLFGRGFLGRGHAIDLVMQAGSEDVPTGRQPWHGRTVFVGRTRDGSGVLDRARRQGLEVLHDLSSLRLARKQDYDAIQVRDKFIAAAVGILVARLRGLKFFFWLSFPMPESDIENARSGNAFFPPFTMARGLLTRALLYHWILPRADHVFVQSERMKSNLVGKGIAPDKLTPVPMGFDTQTLPANLQKPLRRPDMPLVIGYLGTLDASRKLEVLIDSLALVRRAGREAHLLLVGGAHARRDIDALRARATELGVADHVEITGMLPRAQAIQCISECDVAVSPIFRSAIFDVGSPTKLLEYLGLGLPVVANDQPEQKFILRATRAGVCVPWGARHFARAILWLWSRGPDELADRAARGRDWIIRHRAYPVLIEELERSYQEALAQPGTREAAAQGPN
jgi:glycosyltransferase involved in cell wall biosynthesis